jgi:hypothetical protein
MSKATECQTCGGKGWYADRDPRDPEEPVQVQCEACEGTGDAAQPTPADAVERGKLVAEVERLRAEIIGAYTLEMTLADLRNAFAVAKERHGAVQVGFVVGTRAVKAIPGGAAPGAVTLPQLLTLEEFGAGLIDDAEATRQNFANIWPENNE